MFLKMGGFGWPDSIDRKAPNPRPLSKKRLRGRHFTAHPMAKNGMARRPNPTEAAYAAYLLICISTVAKIIRKY